MSKINVKFLLLKVKMSYTFISIFFDFFGSQNDYLYPTTNDLIGYTPFKKPHLWKTRFGFKTSYNLAKYITSALN
jgi:hypothetical protein